MCLFLHRSHSVAGIWTEEMNLSLQTDIITKHLPPSLVSPSTTIIIDLLLRRGSNFQVPNLTGTIKVRKGGTMATSKSGFGQIKETCHNDQIQCLTDVLTAVNLSWLVCQFTSQYLFKVTQLQSCQHIWSQPKLLTWPCWCRWQHQNFKLSMCTLFYSC